MESNGSKVYHLMLCDFLFIDEKLKMESNGSKV